jgi:hypothetical protein
VLAAVAALACGIPARAQVPSSANMQNFFGSFGNALGGAMGNAVGNAVTQPLQNRPATQSWQQANPRLVACLQRNYHITGQQQSANGIGPNDPRIQPYVDQCNKEIARQPTQPHAAGQSHASANPSQGSTQGGSAAAGKSKANDDQTETVFWESIKDSKDPSDFQEYLKQYPNGHFAGLAHNRLVALGKSETQPTTMVTTTPAKPEAVPQTAAADATTEGKRVALVVGNGGYKNVAKLDNTLTDAKLIATTLKKLGFEVIGGGAQTDLDRVAFVKAIASFGDKLEGSAVGVFYYAGHGIQMQGSNFLVPIDANPSKPSDADIQLVDAQLVLHQMEDSGAKLKVVILDACRNNPFGGRGLRDTGGGLAQMRTPEGTLISYATQPGNVAQDGTAGGDSPYTTALAKSMTQRGMDVLQMFNDVGLQVDGATGGSQEPWVASSPIRGRFYFAGSN